MARGHTEFKKMDEVKTDETSNAKVVKENLKHRDPDINKRGTTELDPMKEFKVNEKGLVHHMEIPSHVIEKGIISTAANAVKQVPGQARSFIRDAPLGSALLAGNTGMMVGANAGYRMGKQQAPDTADGSSGKKKKIVITEEPSAPPNPAAPVDPTMQKDMENPVVGKSYDGIFHDLEEAKRVPGLVKSNKRLKVAAGVGIPLAAAGSYALGRRNKEEKGFVKDTIDEVKASIKGVDNMRGKTEFPVMKGFEDVTTKGGTSAECMPPDPGHDALEDEKLKKYLDKKKGGKTKTEEEDLTFSKDLNLVGGKANRDIKDGYVSDIQGAKVSSAKGYDRYNEMVEKGMAIDVEINPHNVDQAIDELNAHSQFVAKELKKKVEIKSAAGEAARAIGGYGKAKVGELRRFGGDYARHAGRKLAEGVETGSVFAAEHPGVATGMIGTGYVHGRVAQRARDNAAKIKASEEKGFPPKKEAFPFKKGKKAVKCGPETKCGFEKKEGLDDEE